MYVYLQDTTSKCPKESYANVCYTPKGLAYYSDWGTLRNTGNMMFLATLMGKYGQQVRPGFSPTPLGLRGGGFMMVHLQQGARRD